MMLKRQPEVRKRMGMRARIAGGVPSLLSSALHTRVRVLRPRDGCVLRTTKTQMKRIPLILSLTLAVCAQARMVRVVSVDDARTLTVEHGGKREQIQLAGVEILDSQQAAQLLRWTVGSAWVLAEPHPGGGCLVYRSPDALFVNRELVVRGYARATAFGIEPESNLRVTYLGQVEAPVISPPRGTRTHTYPRSSTPPSRKTSAAAKGSPRAAPKRSRASTKGE